MPSCQNFKQKIEEFKKKTEGMRLALERYKNGQKEYLEIFEEDYIKLEEEIEEFRENEYKDKTKKIIKTWYPFISSQSYIDSFIDDLKFDKTGRVIYHMGLPVRIFTLNKVLSFFPNLIKEVAGNFELLFANIEHVENLEKVNGELDLTGNKTIKSFKILKKIGNSLIMRESTVKQFDSLEEIGGDLVINDGNSNIKTVEDFLKTFPKLKKIGKDPFGVSIYVPSGLWDYFIQEFKKLKAEGRLEFDGRIVT